MTNNYKYLLTIVSWLFTKVVVFLVLVKAWRKVVEKLQNLNQISLETS